QGPLTPGPSPPRGEGRKMLLAVRLLLVEAQLRGRPEEDEIPRRVAERAVDRQDRDLERLPRLRAVGQLDPGGRGAAADGAAAALAEGQVDLAVHPDLAVIVHRGPEPDRGARDVLAVDLLGDGHLDAVPGHAELARAVGLFEQRRILDRFPLGVVVLTV